MLAPATAPLALLDAGRPVTLLIPAAMRSAHPMKPVLLPGVTTAATEVPALGVADGGRTEGAALELGSTDALPLGEGPTLLLLEDVPAGEPEGVGATDDVTEGVGPGLPLLDGDGVGATLPLPLLLGLGSCGGTSTACPLLEGDADAAGLTVAAALGLTLGLEAVSDPPPLLSVGM